jgi:hypothetical protein
VLRKHAPLGRSVHPKRFHRFSGGGASRRPPCRKKANKAAATRKSGDHDGSREAMPKNKLPINTGSPTIDHLSALHSEVRWIQQRRQKLSPQASEPHSTHA